MVIAT
jgi:ubiquitin-activating enzyme E1